MTVPSTWNGSAFVEPGFKVWNGSAFVNPELHVWDGSAFEKVWPSPSPKPQIIGTPASAAAASVALPTHAVGDIIVFCAFRNSTTTNPTKPVAAGTVPAWVDIDNGPIGNACALRTAYFVATAANHTSGTWTGSNCVSAIVLRGQATSPIGGHAVSTSGVMGQSTAPAVTLSDSSGSSMLLHFHAFAATVSTTSWSSATVGYTRQTAIVAASTVDGLALNTKDDTTTDGSVVQAYSAGTGGDRNGGATIEILAP